MYDIAFTKRKRVLLGGSHGAAPTPQNIVLDAHIAFTPWVPTAYGFWPWAFSNEVLSFFNSDNVTVEFGVAAGPAGAQDALTLTNTNVTAGDCEVWIKTTDAGFVSGSPTTIIVQAKKNASNFLYINIGDNTAQNFASAVFDLNAGVVGETVVGSSSGTIVSTSINEGPNGYYTCTMVGYITTVGGTWIAYGLAEAATGNTWDVYGEVVHTLSAGALSIDLYNPTISTANNLFVEGAWSAGVEAWNASSAPTYNDMVTIDPNAFPAKTVLSWSFPQAHPSGGDVWAYPYVAYGREGAGYLPHLRGGPPYPKQINAFSTLSVTYNVIRGFADNTADIMFECETSSGNPINNGNGTNEVSFFAYTPSYFVSYILGLAQSLNYSAGGLNAYIARSGAGAQILIMPVTAPSGTTPLDLSSGTQTWDVLAILQYLVTQGWISGTDYVSGFSFGAEVGQGVGTLTFNSLAWTWN